MNYRGLQMDYLGLHSIIRIIWITTDNKGINLHYSGVQVDYFGLQGDHLELQVDYLVLRVDCPTYLGLSCITSGLPRITS